MSNLLALFENAKEIFTSNIEAYGWELCKINIIIGTLRHVLFSLIKYIRTFCEVVNHLISV